MSGRTEYQGHPNSWKISAENSVLTLGSCFAETMGHRFGEMGCAFASNPFGTVFNPIPISGILNRVITGKKITMDEIVQDRENYFSWDFSSRANSKDEILNSLNDRILRLNALLRNNPVAVLTFGTSFAWKLRENGRIVANCHKVPGQNFEKVLLSMNEMKSAVSNSFQKLFSQFADAKVILTVSPVRHTKEGLEGNQLSKSLLRVLCSELVNEFPSVKYFPAYEIVMDDLRDYKWYKQDLIHITEEAENYVWGKFGEVFLNQI
jgi:hypothetical protein